MHNKPLRLFIIFLSCYLRVTAATPAVHISAKPGWLVNFQAYNKRIPPRSIENGYFYQLAEEQIHVEKQADYRHYIREIVSEAGIQNGSEISVSFDPSYERVEFHQITIWRNNVALNRLNSNAFKMIADEKDLSRFIYQGSYSAYCILPDVRKGDRIEYSFTITGRNAIFNNKYCRDIYFGGSVPTGHLYKCLLTSDQRKLYFKAFNKVPVMETTLNNGIRCYEWQAFQVMPEYDYNNQPGWYNASAYTQVSEYANWQQVADWAMRINPITTNLTGELAKQVQLLKTQAGSNKQVYFRKAVTLVQDEVRYMGIEMGEYSHRANNPAKVFAQRYGDCKDKALLLASILNANGIPAQMALVNSSVGSKIDRFIPSPNVFDHAVVVATVNGKQVWVDATMSYQRGSGTNLYFPAYGKALVLKAGVSSLTSIPPAHAGRSYINETFKVADETSKVDLKVKSTYTLNEADRIRDRLASTGINGTEKEYLDYYLKIYPKVEAVDSITILDNEEKNELTTIEHYTISNFFKRDSTTGKYLRSFYSDYIADGLPNISNTANLPVALTMPYNIDHTINVVMPDGWSISEDHISIKRDAYEFEARTFAESDTLTLRYHLSHLQDNIPVSKFDEYRDDYKKITDEAISYSFSYWPGGKDLPFRMNYWMLALCIVTVLIILIAAVKIYRTKTDEILFAPGATFRPIGGWLILIALGLATTPLMIMAKFFDYGYLNLNNWNFGIENKSYWDYNTVFVFEAVSDIFLSCYACFCLVMLLNKRDILPRYIIAFYISAVVLQVLDCVLMSYSVGFENSDDNFYNLIKTIMVAVLWASYFYKSERVQQTFIVPFPADNFSYEEDAEAAKT